MAVTDVDTVYRIEYSNIEHSNIEYSIIEYAIFKILLEYLEYSNIRPNVSGKSAEFRPNIRLNI